MLTSLALIFLAGLAMAAVMGAVLGAVSPAVMVLSVAVLGILITAPLGAIGMDLTYKKLLSQHK